MTGRCELRPVIVHHPLSDRIIFYTICYSTTAPFVFSLLRAQQQSSARLRSKQLGDSVADADPALSLAPGRVARAQPQRAPPQVRLLRLPRCLLCGRQARAAQGGLQMRRLPTLSPSEVGQSTSLLSIFPSPAQAGLLHEEPIHLTAPLCCSVL